jgi:hypothetical protein
MRKRRPCCREAISDTGGTKRHAPGQHYAGPLRIDARRQESIAARKAIR